MFSLKWCPIGPHFHLLFGGLTLSWLLLIKSCNKGLKFENPTWTPFSITFFSKLMGFLPRVDGLGAISGL